MAVSNLKVGTFGDWIGLFNDWRKEIGVDHDEIRGFNFDTLFGAIETDDIQFGHWKGRKKWENLRQVPTQQIRDALINLIVYQGDTEFASVEQQRWLFQSAPSEYDRKALTRVMIEEMRHGWQMCALLVEHFGHSGKMEAQKMLERRAFENRRLLGSFNEDDYNRSLYWEEVNGLVKKISNSQKPGSTELFTPHIKFNRNIGKWKEQKNHVRTGEPIDDAAYETHLKEVMPGPEDKKLLMDIIQNEPKWIAPRDNVRDPVSTSGEVRKSAINITQ